LFFKKSLKPNKHTTTISVCLAKVLYSMLQEREIDVGMIVKRELFLTGSTLSSWINLGGVEDNYPGLDMGRSLWDKIVTRKGKKLMPATETSGTSALKRKKRRGSSPVIQEEIEYEAGAIETEGSNQPPLRQILNAIKGVVEDIKNYIDTYLGDFREEMRQFREIQAQ
ncbi:hypothetical protein Ddye_023368, partial [Dipteronia dyeriana]